MLQQGSLWRICLEVRDVHDHFLQFLKLRFNKGLNELTVCQLLTLKNMFLPMVVVSQVEGFSW